MAEALSSEKYYNAMSNRDSVAYNGLLERFAGRFKIKFDKYASYRQKKLEILKMFLDSSIYDNLQPFYIEFNGETYIKLADRRPSVTYPICKIIVDESSSMLFGEGHFPVVRCSSSDDDKHEKTTQFLQYITRVCHLKELMLLAAKIGSVGSVCIILKVLNGKFYFEALGTKSLTPLFDDLAPDKLLELTDKRKIDGSTLKSFGYTVKNDDLNKFFWLMRKWDKQREIFYKPYLCEKDDDENFRPSEDKEKNVDHDFGFVPAVWIKNLPDNNIDGACTFQPALDISVEIDYQLSQNGRLLKYNSDPTLVVKNPSQLEGGALIKGQMMLQLDESGDAYYAEMNGKSCEAVIEFVKLLREYGLEAVRGNRVSPEKMSNAQSGIGFEMMNMALVGLVEEMRLTYGDYGLMSIYCMVLAIAKEDKYAIDYGDYAPDNDKNCEDHLILDWPAWYPPTAAEKLQESQALTNYTTNNVLSASTAIKSIADEFNIMDIESELKDIDTAKKAEQTLNNKVNPMQTKIPKK